MAAGLGAIALLASSAPAMGAARIRRSCRAPAREDQPHLLIEFENEGYEATFGPGSVATYLNGTLRPEGELLQNYYAIGHDSLDNYIAQVSGSPRPRTPRPTARTTGSPSPTSSRGLRILTRRPTPGRSTVRAACIRRRSDDRRTTRCEVPAEQEDRTSPRGGPTSRTWATLPHATAEPPTPRVAPTAPTRASAPRTPPRWRRLSISTRPGTTHSCGSTPSSTTARSAMPTTCLSGRWAPMASRRPWVIWPATSAARPPPRDSGSSRPTCATTATTTRVPGPTARGARGRPHGRRRVPQVLDAPHPGLPRLQARGHAGRHHVRRVRCRRTRRSRRLLQRVLRAEHPCTRETRVPRRTRGTRRRPDRRPAAQLQVHREGLDRYHWVVQPLLGTAQLRGPPRTHDRRYRRQGPPRLCGGHRASHPSAPTCSRPRSAAPDPTK